MLRNLTIANSKVSSQRNNIIELTNYDETEKRAHDSQIGRANENLKLSHCTVGLAKFSYMYRVKSAKFGHQVNSDTHLQTVNIQMRRLVMSRLIRIFTVCLLIYILFQYLKYETNKVAVRI